MIVIPNLFLKFPKRFSYNHFEIKRFSKVSPLKFLVPSLSQTLEKYVKCLQPLISEDELNHTQKLLVNFSRHGGEGEILQKLLSQKAEKTDNWLAEWWKSVAYLNGRDPIVINSNPGIRFPIENFKTSEDWIYFSTNLLTSILKYKLLIDNDEIPQEFLKDEPLCMHQYYNIFATCRVPGVGKDEIFNSQSHLLRADQRSNYIIVAHKNRFFQMEVIDQKSQRIYCKESINRGFYKIIEMSQTKGQPLGLMTAENRDVWAKSYTRLLEIPANQKTFSIIQNSLLLLCLDSNVLVDIKETNNFDSVVARNMLHGNGHKFNSANRWFDKTLQVIISSDGACGINYEHSPAEAPPLVSIIDFAFNNMRKEITESGDVYDSSICPTHELEFSLDNQTRQDIDNAKRNISSLVNDLELHAVSFNDFGKSKIKIFKVSPDAFIQVGLQLAYFNMHNAPGSTYESGSLRRYKFGRTDTIRTCTPEVVSFCKAMKNSSVNDSEKKELLLSAIKHNSKYTKEVLNGQGIDRHLLGLKLIALENNIDMPNIFMDTSYMKAMHHVLSTSQGGSSNDLTMCFGPGVPDGYGFCYNPRPEKILTCISAINSSPSTSVLKLADYLRKAFTDMACLLGQ